VATAVRQLLRYERFTLASGLEVLLHDDPKATQVAVNVRYHVGSKDEEPGRTGFAHLFEHLLFQGSKHVGEDRFFRYLEEVGAVGVNGTTSHDRTNYYETVPAAHRDLALWLESDRMGFLLDHLSEATFEGQRKVVKNELRERFETAPYGAAYLTAVGALFPPGHPYHHTPIGSHADLDAATAEEAKRFFLRYYTPANARLVLAGALGPGVRAAVERYFGTLPSRPKPATVRTPQPSPLTRDVRLRVEAGVELPRLFVAWSTPVYATADDPRLDVLATVLASGDEAVLHRRLVRDTELATAVEASQGSGIIAGVFTIEAPLTRGRDPRRALAVLDDALRRLAEQGPTAAEVEAAKAKLTLQDLASLELVGRRAESLNLYADVAGDPTYLATVLEQYHAVTPESLRDAARRLLFRRPRVALLTSPKAMAPVAGVVTGREEVAL
jgi:predicted Zn-dependent peptidase